MQPRKDSATVTADGESLERRIDGVTVRRLRPIEDKRGEIIEVYRPGWGLHADPLVYVYQSTLRPGAIKGWIVHEHQDDRLFLNVGVMRWVLYDARAGSPTHKLLNELVFSDRNRALLVIPRGVYHAVQNIGSTDALFLNMPTAPYRSRRPG